MVGLSLFFKSHCLPRTLKGEAKSAAFGLCIVSQHATLIRNTGPEPPTPLLVTQKWVATKQKIAGTRKILLRRHPPPPLVTRVT